MLSSSPTCAAQNRWHLLRRRTALTTLASLVAVAGGAGCNRCRPLGQLAFDRGPSVVYSDRLESVDRPLAVLGDTQRTSLAECLIGREVNDLPQRALLDAVAREDPSGIALVGDMVSAGASEEDWQYFDWLMRPVYGKGIPVLPLMGNHDYDGPTAAALWQVRHRFPRLRERGWYTVKLGRLGLIWLDSNCDQLGRRWAEQTRWYQETVQALGADGAIRGIIVFAHHAPYTRRADIDGKDDVVRDLVPPYVGASKGLAFITGHTHTYEHYIVSGRHFLVSSGGGGPRPDRLVAPGDRGLRDECSVPLPRPLHYLLVSQDPDGISIQTRGLSPTTLDVSTIDTIRIPFAANSDH